MLRQVGLGIISHVGLTCVKELEADGNPRRLERNKRELQAAEEQIRRLDTFANENRALRAQNDALRAQVVDLQARTDAQANEIRTLHERVSKLEGASPVSSLIVCDFILGANCILDDDQYAEDPLENPFIYEGLGINAGESKVLCSVKRDISRDVAHAYFNNKQKTFRVSEAALVAAIQSSPLIPDRNAARQAFFKLLNALKGHGVKFPDA